tara:strand:- start:422 stop:1012 length:591 start_codon:yes stop_codon:yes gene_type:complete
MNKDLLRDNYLIVRNFINKDYCNLLANYHKDNQNYLYDDYQVEGSRSRVNPTCALEIQCMELRRISDIIQQPIFPTYNLLRLYTNGNELKKHTDRRACEISVTLHLGGDLEWPIWIETPNGEFRSVNLQTGDIMIYLGCTAPHWRDIYKGEWYCQVFLHYVRSQGMFSNYFYDLEKSNLDCDLKDIEKLKKEYSLL